METTNSLPEFISGIPTAKNQSRERMDLLQYCVNKIEVK